MQKFPMKFFKVIASLLLITLATGCAPTLKEGIWLHNTPYKSGGIPQVYDPSPGVQSYDFVLERKGMQIDGIVIIKSENGGSRRVVMTSLFGMTFLDFELKGETIKINYCIEQLNRERVILLFKKDFEILFNPDHSHVTKYLFNSDGTIKELEQGNSITRVHIAFGGYSGQYPQEIKIGHPWLRIKLHLKKSAYEAGESVQN